MVDPNAGIIEEIVKSQNEVHQVTLRQRGNTFVFDASDKLSTFSGTLEFGGPAWAFTNATYNIQMTDGSGRISGNASFSPTTIDQKNVRIVNWSTGCTCRGIAQYCGPAAM